MNSKDRNRLIELYDLADKVPFPIMGDSFTASATVKGFVDYAADMREFVPAFKQALYALLCEGREGYQVGIDYELPDDMIEALKAWVDERSRSQWERPTLYWQFFYRDWKAKKYAESIL